MLPRVIAYLDPGTGSLLLAAFAGGFPGIAVLLRLYWHRVLGVFSKRHRHEAERTARELIGEDPQA